MAKKTKTNKKHHVCWVPILTLKMLHSWPWGWLFPSLVSLAAHCLPAHVLVGNLSVPTGHRGRGFVSDTRMVFFCGLECYAFLGLGQEWWCHSLGRKQCPKLCHAHEDPLPVYTQQRTLSVQWFQTRTLCWAGGGKDKATFRHLGPLWSNHSMWPNKAL